VDEFIDREVASDRSQQPLDGSLIAIYIQQTTNNLRSTDRVDTLYVDLDELGEIVLIEVKNEVMNKVKAVANDDERELVGQLGFLEEIFDFLGIVIVTFSTNTFDFPDLAGSCGSLDVLEMNLRVSTEVDNGPKIVVET